MYLRYCRYFDAWRRTPADVLTAIDQLAFLRRAYLGNSAPVVCLGIPRWKRRAITAMLDGPAGAPAFVRSVGEAKALAKQRNAAIAAWGTTAITVRPRIEAEGIACIAIEDGFLRSAGLGAAFVQPLSLVFDSRGIYFDPSRPSDIEHMLETCDLPEGDRGRASQLCRRILADRITKYTLRPLAAALPDVPAGREVVLVAGQVADDAAIEFGRLPGFEAGTNINAELLARARASHPDAYVIFKPHPDVEDMGRKGALGRAHEAGLADYIARRTPLDALFPLCNRVEVYSSLTGFEALLRGIPVTTHGLPFYAGWGLTRDHAHTGRRHRQRSLDELAAVALIRYPRYWDPESGLVCPPEVAIDRIGEHRTRAPGMSGRAGKLLGRAVIIGRRLRQAVRGAKS